MKISDEFHIWYEKNRIWEKTSWMGVPTYKLPFDAWIMQELIWKVQPNLIVETGSGKGGSALFYASILHCIGDAGRVISVDKNGVDWGKLYRSTPPKIFDRILFYNYDSLDERVVRCIDYWSNSNSTVMIMLDSWHSKEHVLKELELYSPYVSVGSYLIVEDTHVDGNPVPWEYGEGPMGAVKEFLKDRQDFIVDKDCEKLGFTFNPNGYLKRVR